ncbi:hypothetical protein GCM10025790_22380 [Nesterenkonia rhizosphaerae]|uniref:Uncharacterized protein n=2 Tax=Nesterenkonia rhizosphaerae TaxID=1348272 RepID=A0ABP9G0B2_9MICC
MRVGLKVRVNAVGGIVATSRVLTYWLVVAICFMTMMSQGVLLLVRQSAGQGLEVHRVVLFFLSLGLLVFTLCFFRVIRLETPVGGVWPAVAWESRRLGSFNQDVAEFVPEDVVEIRVRRSQFLAPAAHLIVQGHRPMFLARVRSHEDKSLSTIAEALGTSVRLSSRSTVPTRYAGG